MELEPLQNLVQLMDVGKESSPAISKARQRLAHLQAHDFINKSLKSGSIDDLQKAIKMAEEHAPVKLQLLEDRLKRAFWEQKVRQKTIAELLVFN